jgi:tetratricopeptide (TPR) repeat protein
MFRIYATLMFLRLALALVLLTGRQLTEVAVAAPTAQGAGGNNAAINASGGALTEWGQKVSPEIAARLRHANTLRTGLEAEKAVEEYTKIIQMAPDLVEGYYGRARAYQDLENFEAAAREFEHVAFEGSVVRIGALEALASLYHAQHNYALAKLNYNRLLDMKDRIAQKVDVTAMQVGRAECELHLNQPSATIEDASAALHSLNPGNVRSTFALRSRARAYLMLHDNKKALADYDTAIITFNSVNLYSTSLGGSLTLSELLKERADLHEQMGHPELAKRDRDRVKKQGHEDFDLAPFMK